LNKKYVFVLSAVLFLVPITLAESVDLGPYELSFELDSNYSIAIQNPINGTNLIGVDYVDYSIFIYYDENWAQINVTDYTDPISASNYVTQKMVRKGPRGMSYLNMVEKERLIDKRTGFLCTFEGLSGETVYKSAYWPNRYLQSGDYVGQTCCLITSNLPWTMTNKLLKTVHIEHSPLESHDTETVSIGDYNLSFDLEGIDYKIVAEEPERDRIYNRLDCTEYQIRLESDDSLKHGNKAVIITITEFDEPRELSIKGDKLLVEAALSKEGFRDGITISERDIDSHNGVLGTGSDDDYSTMYLATYWPDQSSTEKGYHGKINCQIKSTYKWSTTDNLLSTIQLERREVN